MHDYNVVEFAVSCAHESLKEETPMWKDEEDNFMNSKFVKCHVLPLPRPHASMQQSNKVPKFIQVCFNNLLQNVIIDLFQFMFHFSP